MSYTLTPYATMTDKELWESEQAYMANVAEAEGFTYEPLPYPEASDFAPKR